MPRRGPVEVGFAVAKMADGAVDLGDFLFRHQLLQEQHVLRGYGCVDHEIAAREGEQQAHLIGAKEEGIDIHRGLLSGVGMQNGQHKRHLITVNIQPAHDVTRLVAEKMMLQHLQFEAGARNVKLRLQVARDRRLNTGHVSVQIFKWDVEGVSVQQLSECTG